MLKSKRIITQEWRNKISVTRKERMASGEIVHPRGMTGKSHSKEARAKISQANILKQVLEKTRIRMSESRKQFWESHPEQKILHRAYFSGPKSNFWKGGLTAKNQIERQSSTYKEWRKSVFVRDNYTCQKCGIRGGKGVKVILNADHIKMWSTHPNLRFDLSNGRTLCLPCHRKTETWGGNTKFKKTYVC